MLASTLQLPSLMSTIEGISRPPAQLGGPCLMDLRYRSAAVGSHVMRCKIPDRGAIEQGAAGF